MKTVQDRCILLIRQQHYTELWQRPHPAKATLGRGCDSH